MTYACPIHPSNTHTTYNQNTPYLIGQCDAAMVTGASLNMLKGLAQAKIIKESVILFWFLNMTI